MIYTVRYGPGGYKWVEWGGDTTVEFGSRRKKPCLQRYWRAEKGGGLERMGEKEV